MKRFACLMIVIYPLWLSAQNAVNPGGIQWMDGLNWEQVKEKAKQENKCIFLDCFTTWCSPCKMMDNSVYLNDSVGNYMNSRFISVKVQMDKTEKDNEQVKQWYNDAVEIGNQYHVEGYPTYVFLSPAGNIVHKEMGLKSSADFITMAEVASQPGKVYDDPYSEYYHFVKVHKTGEKDYNRYPLMILTAFKLGDTNMGAQLQKELTDYVSSLPRSERYTKDRIAMWSEFNISSKSRVFQFFFSDGTVIDQIMGIKGYAANIVDRTIQREICVPFMEEQAKGSGVGFKGMYLTGPDVKAIEGEANWTQLNSTIRRRFGQFYAKLSTLTAQIEWAARHSNPQAGIKYSLLKFKEFPPDFNDMQIGVTINSVAWDAFITSNEPKVLNECIAWMAKLVHHKGVFVNAYDTYANLLYKIGRRQEALQWQQKAVQIAPGAKNMVAALQDMQQGRPTYVKQGAVWPSLKNTNYSK